MKIQDIMTKPVISIQSTESVAVAARTLTQYNIGILPVCDGRGNLRGLVTDRDLVTRCIALGKPPKQTMVREVMTARITTAQPDMDAAVAAHLMGRQQVRRLPVLEQGKLCGIVSLGDLAKWEDSAIDAADVLYDITNNVSTW